MKLTLAALVLFTTVSAFAAGGLVISGGGSSGSGSITNLPSTTNILIGNGAGGAADSGVSATGLLTTNSLSNITNIVDTTDLVVGTLYTNLTSSNLTLYASVVCGNASAKAVLLIDGNTAGFVQSSAGAMQGMLSGYVKPNSTYKILEDIATIAISGGCSRIYSPLSQSISLAGGTLTPAQLAAAGVVTNGGFAFLRSASNGVVSVLFKNGSQTNFFGATDTNRGQAFISALAAQQDGCVIVLGSGVFDIGTNRTARLSNSVSIFGQGQYTTTIIATNNSQFGIINPGYTNEIGHLSIIGRSVAGQTGVIPVQNSLDGWNKLFIHDCYLQGTIDVNVLQSTTEVAIDARYERCVMRNENSGTSDIFVWQGVDLDSNTVLTLRQCDLYNPSGNMIKIDGYDNQMRIYSSILYGSILCAVQDVPKPVGIDASSVIYDSNWSTSSGYVFTMPSPQLLMALPYRSGQTNIANLATSRPVVFTSPFSPDISTNYSVTFGFEGTVSAAAALSATAKTTNGFTVNIIGITTGATVDYQAWPYR